MRHVTIRTIVQPTVTTNKLKNALSRPMNMGITEQVATSMPDQWIVPSVIVWGKSMIIYVILILKKTVNTMENFYTGILKDKLLQLVLARKDAVVGLLIASTGFTRRGK